MPGHFHFICDQIVGNEVVFGETEAKHMLGVLRYSISDEISFTNGNGTCGFAIITSINKKVVKAQILKQQLNKRSKNLALACGILKQNDRMEWLVEKCTELGVSRIVFMPCKNSQKNKLNLDRLNKKAYAALKQSHGCFLPKLELLSFKEALNIEGHKYIAFCKADEKKVQASKMTKEAIVYIGPEGDFTQEEIEMALQKGAQSLDLGERILRTETAALLACGVHYL